MNMFLEIKNCFKLFSPSYKEERKLVFYSESGAYYKYFKAFIDKILDNSDLSVFYITSDIQDDVFKNTNPKFKPIYIEKLVPFVLPIIDCKALVMTMPDINQFHLKRSLNKDVNHIYIFHAIVSSHMMYRKGAFNFYDTVFCVGSHHVKELKKQESIYNLPKKKLIEVGYPLLEEVNQNYFSLEKKSDKKNANTCLIAPSWHENNIIENCGVEIVSKLLENNYKVIFRPHPQSIMLYKKEIIKKFEKFKDDDLFELEIKPESNESILHSDILITDWSGIAFEYALGMEKPVLFINTPPKVFNKEFEKLEIEPLEVSFRKEVGKLIELSDIKTSLVSSIKDLIENKDTFKEKVSEYRDNYIYNWGHSAEIGAKYLIDICK